MIDIKQLEKIEEYIDSGDLAFDFENGDEERRYALLDALEKLMELGEKADEQATKLIFKKGFMEQLAGIPTPENPEEDSAGQSGKESGNGSGNSSAANGGKSENN